VGIALALAAFGAVCLATRKSWPRESSGLVHVVGRVPLSPKHSIYLVRAGERTLLIGTGAQGAPTLLAELGENEGLDGQSARAAVRSTSSRVDIRLGEDE
jgi:flagellar biogenesis protein FliO